MKKIQDMGASISPGLGNYPLQLWDNLFGARHPVQTSEQHLRATFGWLCNAQDVGSDDGTARMYHYRNGWGASYPETTGYLIPSFLHYADYTGESEYAQRALRMAAWESAIQMDTGAVQGGVVTDEPSPAIFNTGQVLFGWCAAYVASEEDKFRQSATNAAAYLNGQMDNDGAWRRNLSAFCDSPDDTCAYNVRSAWALLCTHRKFGDDQYKMAAIRNVDFVVDLARDNGWIAKNCLNRPKQPLLHTISYAYQGLSECAEILGHHEAMNLVIRGNQALIENFDYFGQLHGRYADDWNPTVKWRCLTGEAQTEIVWQRLAAITGNQRWRAAAKTLITQLKKTQSLRGAPGIAGGIKGSHPITAPYGRLEYLNWAAKFFAHALMLELGVKRSFLDG